MESLDSLCPLINKCLWVLYTLLYYYYQEYNYCHYLFVYRFMNCKEMKEAKKVIIMTHTNHYVHAYADKHIK